MARGLAKATLKQIEVCAEILEEIQPATVRAVCYRLFVAGLLDSMAKKNTNRISRILTTAREQGLISWEWIVDETRAAEHAPTWSSASARINCAIRNYRRDYWQEQDVWVEVWSEKGTVRGTLAPVLDQYGVTFRVMHGYGSATALHEVATLTSGFRSLTVLYVGDYDCSGMHMSEVDLPTRLDDYGGLVDIHRVALTEADTDLPHFDASEKWQDPRYGWYVNRYGRRCWELDAMPPPDLRARVEEAIVELIDMESWDHAIEIERAEVESLNSFAQQWEACIASHPAGGAA